MRQTHPDILAFLEQAPSCTPSPSHLEYGTAVLPQSDVFPLSSSDSIKTPLDVREVVPTNLTPPSPSVPPVTPSSTADRAINSLREETRHFRFDLSIVS